MGVRTARLSQAGPEDFVFPCAAGLAQSEATRPEGYQALSFFPS